MHYANLATILAPLLIQSQQSIVGEAASRLTQFVIFAVILFLLAALCLTFLTLFFGSLAAPVVLGVKWLYRTSVQHWMNVPGGTARAPLAPPRAAPTHAPPKLQFELHDPDAPRGDGDCPLNRRAAEASRAVTRVYVAAAAAYAVAMTPLAVYVGFDIRSTMSDLSAVGTPLLYLSAFVALMWLPVLTYMVTAVARRRRKLTVAAAYWLLLSSPTIFLPQAEAEKASLTFFFTWVLLMSAPTSTMFVLRFSGVGGLALGMILSLAASALALAFKFFAVVFNITKDSPPAVGREAVASPGIEAGLTAFGLLLAGPLAAAVAAAALLWWMSHRYARKRTSEQILLMDIFWLVTTFIISLVSHLLGAGWYTWLGPLSFVLYELVLWAGLGRLERVRGGGRELRLLLLRVFGAKRRSEWLLKRLGHYWRYSGSIQLIAAPDLAGVNLELDELLDYMRGRLKRRFIKDARDCARRVESLDVLPDPDGRYRVNEFFSHADVWQETVAALTRRSDAVLMDLRGFRRNNRGCVYELHHMVNSVPVNRLIITVNDGTDHVFLRQTFEEAWAGMGEHSPNRDVHAPVLRLLNIRRQNSRAVGRLLSMLCEAAESGASATAPAHAPVAAGLQA